MRRCLRSVFALVFILAGLNHFRAPDFYLGIMPPYLPAPALLVRISGIAEILLGILLLFRRWQRVAGWGIIALLLAVYPANWNMALHPERFSRFSPIVLWLRIPAQLLLMAWAWMYARRKTPA